MFADAEGKSLLPCNYWMYLPAEIISLEILNNGLNMFCHRRDMSSWESYKTLTFLNPSQTIVNECVWDHFILIKYMANENILN